MTVTFIRKDGKRLVHNNVYDVYELKRYVEDKNMKRTLTGTYIGVNYPDDLDYGVEAEMEYNTDNIERVVITFTDNMVNEEREAEKREACGKCAYNDEGSCSCFGPASIGCPYADDEEEGD